MMTGTAHQTRRPRAATLVAAGLAIAFAVLLWPAAADAQTRALRPKCEKPERVLNVTPSDGSATTFAAREPLLSCVTGGPTSFRVKQTCTYHCQHWHTWVPTGTPAPANVQLEANPAAGSFLVGWSGNCVPRLGQPRTDCTVRVASTPTSVTAVMRSTPDGTAPTPPVIGAPTPSSYTAVVRWSPASDESGVAAYDVFHDRAAGPVARAAGTATSVKVTNLRCDTTYNVRVEAFDTAGNSETSASIPLTTGKCVPTKPPNTIMHVKPPKTTKGRTAYFHWGASRTRVTYQCKLDKGRWTSCRPGKTYRNLKKGTHTFQVRARDAGGVDPTPATWRWRIR